MLKDAISACISNISATQTKLLRVPVSFKIHLTFGCKLNRLHHNAAKKGANRHNSTCS